ncbi:natural killer cell receptor 2B4 [Pteronotus mesoamericanus]|uniref:natural killer cell receptor 2B4 n=1 Tax=Pteronotus mesoamericanus TaxID=1884717 RepID=UPI0023EC2B04|nr:natural killer cell receptor 2B4 [Pteronotus parnellii mesoamericanus]
MGRAGSVEAAKCAVGPGGPGPPGSLALRQLESAGPRRSDPAGAPLPCPPRAFSLQPWAEENLNILLQAAFFDSSERVLGSSETAVWLHVPRRIQTNAISFEWKVQLHPKFNVCVIVSWKNRSDLNNGTLKCNRLNNRPYFIMKNLSLVIEAAEPRDSGFYHLEATDDEGLVRTHQFNVSVLDPVGPLRLLGWLEALDGGKCRVTLSCLVSGGSNVSYTWYRGRERVLRLSNVSALEQTEVSGSGPHSYTCEVSNLVSGANQTLTLSQGCLSALPALGSLAFGMIVAGAAVALLLGAGVLAGVCVHRRKRKPAEPSPEESLTVYEDVHSLRTRHQEQREKERDSPVAGSTIYASIQPQLPASTPQREAYTLYSVIQVTRKPGPKKTGRSPSSPCTVYDEVGKPGPKARNSVLTRKELENFCVYS